MKFKIELITIGILSSFFQTAAAEEFKFSTHAYDNEGRVYEMSTPIPIDYGQHEEFFQYNIEKIFNVLSQKIPELRLVELESYHSRERRRHCEREYPGSPNCKNPDRNWIHFTGFKGELDSVSELTEDHSVGVVVRCSTYKNGDPYSDGLVMRLARYVKEILYTLLRKEVTSYPDVEIYLLYHPRTGYNYSRYERLPFDVEEVDFFDHCYDYGKQYVLGVTLNKRKISFH